MYTLYINDIYVLTAPLDRVSWWAGYFTGRGYDPTEMKMVKR